MAEQWSMQYLRNIYVMQSLSTEGKQESRTVTPKKECRMTDDSKIKERITGRPANEVGDCSTTYRRRGIIIDEAGVVCRWKRSICGI